MSLAVAVSAVALSVMAAGLSWHAYALQGQANRLLIERIRQQDQEIEHVTEAWRAMHHRVVACEWR